MGDPLLTLSESDLRTIAAALRGGRLVPPFTASSLGRWVGPHHAAALASRLSELNDSGMLPSHFAVVIDAILGSRSADPQSKDPVEFVWTGPEVGVVHSRDTAVVVRELFAQATATVLVVGFAVHQGREVFRSLADRMASHRGLKVRLFLNVRREYQEAAPDEELLRRFGRKFIEQDWPSGSPLPEVFYDPRSLAWDSSQRSSLHAKCVVVDRQVAFVTSANFTEAAQERNIEAGVIVHSPRFAGQLAEQFEQLAAHKVLIQVDLRRVSAFAN